MTNADPLGWCNKSGLTADRSDGDGFFCAKTGLGIFLIGGGGTMGLGRLSGGGGIFELGPGVPSFCNKLTSKGLDNATFGADESG